MIKKNSGGLLIIDYGYMKKKMKNTLKSISNHKHSDVLKNIGKSDITHNINFYLFKKIIDQIDLYKIFIDADTSDIKSLRSGDSILVQPTSKTIRVVGAVNRPAIFEYIDGEKVQSYSGIEPRLGASLKLSDDSSIKISYAKINQYIQNIYNTTTPLPTSRWKTSDPFILPQSNNTYGLGLFKNLNTL